MKKVVSIVLCLVLVLSLAACGGSGSSKAGTYALAEMSMGGETFDAATLEAMGMSMDMFSMELKEDGTGSMTFMDESEDFKWDDKAIKDSTGTEIPYTYKDGKITLEMDGETLVFEKQ